MPDMFARFMLLSGRNEYKSVYGLMDFQHSKSPFGMADFSFDGDWARASPARLVSPYDMLRTR
jgi:hypothetical protein